MRHPQAHRLRGPRASEFHSPHPALLILLFFLLLHLLLVLLFNLSNSCGTMLRVLLESSLLTSADTTKLFFPFFLAIPSVITITQALRGRLLNQLPEYTGFTRDSVVPGDNSLKRTRFIDMACEGGLGIM